MNLIDTGVRPSGYEHAGYAESLREFGTPRPLPRSGAWVLERALNSLSYRDAMGCYPLFCCPNWSELRTDLDELARDLVSISLVADPFGSYHATDLQSCFRDKFLPFKTHFVADMRRLVAKFVSSHHQYYAKRALRTIHVERCDEPGRFLNEWLDLYENLISRHQLSGIRAFSRSAFAVQLAVPGIVMLRATHDDQVVGAHLWYVHGDVVHSHLAAANALGYDLAVSYALYWSALETFADQVRWINFGSGAGLNSDDSDGLTRFKRGWATETRTAYFCGRIFDQKKYAEAVTLRKAQSSSYFPAYRSGEFA